MYTLNQIRQKYLAYFEKQNHVIVPSASLIPENDPTTLFTGSGMQPMVPFLLGQKHPQGTRIADSQKCLRAEDIDEVGDNRHTTFFEMLGNWSLGDYFQAEQIPWMYTFLTKELGLDPNRLYITVFSGNDTLGIPRDDVSVTLWQEQFKGDGIDAQAVENAETNGMQGGRIFYYNEKKNWWSRVGVPENMPVGEPGGPDTEMFWDFGETLGLHEKSPWKDEPCHVNCDCGRFLEIGNNVFMAYVKTESGFEKLSQQNVDFGGGLERIAAAVINNPDVFMVDVFKEIREKLESLTGKKYGENSNDTWAFRVIIDHLRSATFLVGDGAVPSNKDQGYFTRRFVRRAIRFGHQLGLEQNFCGDVVKEIICQYGDAYPNLQENMESVVAEVVKEEEKFRKTLATGLKKFNDMAEGKQSGDMISAQQAFDLYQSYGFPLEMTQELATENKFIVDVDGFNKAFSEHQDLSRAGAEEKFKGGLGGDTEIHRKYHTATHLLHQALREVLGDHVGQKGSNITEKRLRFDFTHPDKMTDEEKKRVESIVNEQIQRDLPISFEVMSVPDAKESGAIGLFEDRYGDKVNVYSIGDFSKEICGGPHVESTGSMGHFRIKKEESSSAGVRRIKAILE